MRLETAESVLRYYGKKQFFTIAPFMNGEPLLEYRLHRFVDYAWKICHTTSIIDTNGTIFKNRHLLIHPHLWKVRFTISAATPETYELVHGKPLFHEAMKTFKWFTEHKLPSQTAWLHFITTKDNVHEVSKWERLFEGYGRTVFPVHRGHGQEASETVVVGDSSEPYWIDAQNVSHRSSNWHDPTSPCQCWSLLAISWDGRILQCPDVPYEFNYGRVGEVDLSEAWRERVHNKMDNPCCRECSVKFPNYKKILDKWVK